MAECQVCGKDVYAYTCRYCKHTHCGDHRLPENHNCPGLDMPSEGERFSSGFTTTVKPDEDESFDGSITTTGVKEAISKLGNRNDPAPKSGDHVETGDKSPDVNPDGSIAGQETTVHHASRTQQHRRQRIIRAVRRWGRRLTVIGFVVLIVLAALVAVTPFQTATVVDSEVTHAFDDFVASISSSAVAVVGNYVPFLTGDDDGDRIFNAQENTSQYPGSSPNQMDLYVRFVVGGEARGIPPSTIAALERRFAEMRITNPDGSTGIDLHVVAINRTQQSLTPRDAPQSIADVFQYVPAYNGSVGCHRLHTVAVSEFASSMYSGQARAPGLLSYVDRTPGTSLTKERAFIQSAIHELLHNLVGERLPAEESIGGIHTFNGYLSQEFVDYRNQMYLSSVTRRVLERGVASVDDSRISC